jgi:pimeloyl-ACP methyl ester carboxylesterase
VTRHDGAVTLEFRHEHVQVGESSLHVVEVGDPCAPPILFLHGWPQSWRAWREVMTIAGRHARAIAIDLPGVGSSTGAATSGAKREIAQLVHAVIAELGLTDVTLVGQDVGGVVAYSYLRSFDDVARIVIMNSAIPGLDPWDELVCNPFVWHIALHSTPGLPELLVAGHQRAYFDYFYDLLSPDPSAITDEARADYAQAYASEAALTAGFNWYRTFGADARAHATSAQKAPETPLLLLHGEHEYGDIGAYVAGLRAVNVQLLDHAVIPAGGHFSSEDVPGEVWKLIADFAGFPS